MKKLLKKYENKLLLVQSDILDGKCPNIEMQIYKNGEQSVLLEIINDLKIHCNENDNSVGKEN